MTANEHQNKKSKKSPVRPPWLEKVRQYSVVVAISLAVSVIVAGSEAVTKFHDALQVFGFVRSEALDLANSTAKSNFSDRLVRVAYTRLYWAEVYATRIQNKISKEDVDVAWRSYVDSSAQWHADLIVNVVGLRNFYNAEKSRFFENDINSQMLHLDSVMSNLRRNQGGEAQAEEFVGQIFGTTTGLRVIVGMFVMCNGPLGTKADLPKLGCSLPQDERKETK
jgi:hypothetical protein